LNTESSPSRFEKLASLLRVLSDDCALRILDKAVVGFKSGKATIKELKLTPRMYYRKLRELNESGILFSSGDEYKLTHLGALIHRLLFNDVSSLLDANQNPMLSLEKAGNRGEFIIINDYNNLTSFLLEAIEKTKSEILLMTRYVDLVVIQSLIYALERNVKLKTVTSSKIDFQAFIKMLGGTLFNIRPNLTKFLVDRENYKSGDVPLSLIVIDNKIAVFEIPDRKFKSAFVSMDKQIVRILSGLFWEIWNQSETLRILPT
jgi:hypothetical protein